MISKGCCQFKSSWRPGVLADLGSGGWVGTWYCKLMSQTDIFGNSLLQVPIAASRHTTMFFGTIKFSPWKRIWKSWAPSNCKFFMWLAINNRCWTSDRLARRGLPHQPACPFCDQADKTINDILSSCVLIREVWSCILKWLRILRLRVCLGASVIEGIEWVRIPYYSSKCNGEN